MSSEPVEILVAALERGGYGPRACGDGQFESRCPGHDGEGHSLGVSSGDDSRALVICRAHGCAVERILEPIGLRVRDLFPTAANSPLARPKRTPRTFPSPEAAFHAYHLGDPVAVWTYLDGSGAETMCVARFDPKSFRPIHRVTEGWRLGDPPGPLPLYRLSTIKDAAQVWVLEGERCADQASELGFCATTSAHGAKSAAKTDWSSLAGKQVVICPDHDEPGESYARTVASLLLQLSPQPKFKIVRIPGLDQGDDIVDWKRDVAPANWGPAECRTELERLADAAPVERQPESVSWNSSNQ